MKNKKEIKERDYRSSSTSSIFLSSTINSPNVKLLIKAVSMIIQSQLLEDMQLGKTVSPKSDLYFFSEEKYVADAPHCFDEDRIKLLRKTPSQEEINDFIEVGLKIILNCYNVILIFRHFITVLNFLQNVVFLV